MTLAHRAIVRRIGAGGLAAAALIAVSACGSSQAAYCSDRASLQSSVKGLTELNVSSGLSGVKDQLTKIQSSAKTLVSSAQSDFPSETSAISGSVDALEKSVQALSSNPSAGQVAGVASDAASVAGSVKTFESASSSKCS